MANGFISGKVTGEQKVISNLKTYSKYMDVGVQNAMETVVELIVEKAMTLAPVDTGKLRKSIVGTVQKMSGDLILGNVEATANYADYIEFGTSKAKAQPFLTPAIEEGLKILTKELENAHKRAASRLSK